MQYNISNQPFTIVSIDMEAGECIKCQSGAMAWMTPGITMETKMGGLGGMFKKAVMGESLGTNFYRAAQPGNLTLAKHSPGAIIALDVATTPVIAQKNSFLASEESVQMDIYLQQKLGAGLVGGEGFVMQSFSGSGKLFLEIDGECVFKELGPGEKLIVDTGYVAAMSNTCSMEIQTVKGVTNVLFGGEGLFNTVVTGPGKVWLQTMPIQAFASSIIPFLPKNN